MKKTLFAIVVLTAGPIVGWYGTKLFLAYMAWSDATWGEWGRFIVGLTIAGLGLLGWAGIRLVDLLIPDRRYTFTQAINGRHNTVEGNRRLYHSDELKPSR